MRIFNPDIISDNLSLHEKISEKVMDQFADINYNTIRGKEDFTCKVVTNGPTADQQWTGQHFFCKVRPMETMHDYCTPDPCSQENYTPTQRKLLLSMQLTVASKNMANQHQRPPKFGDSLKVSFFDEGPNASYSKMRDARFEHKSRIDQFNYGCSFLQIGSIRSAFAVGLGNLGRLPNSQAGNYSSTNTINPDGWTHNGGVIMNDTTVRFMNLLRKSVPSNIPLHVNSMTRSPAAQARALITKINLGDDVVRLYGGSSLIKEALDAIGVRYTPHPTEKKRWIITPPNPKFASNGRETTQMANVFQKQIERGRYISKHMRGNAIDIKVIDWPRSNRQDWIKVVISHAKSLGAKTAEYETTPPHIHLGL